MKKLMPMLVLIFALFFGLPKPASATGYNTVTIQHDLNTIGPAPSSGNFYPTPGGVYRAVSSTNDFVGTLYITLSNASNPWMWQTVIVQPNASHPKTFTFWMDRRFTGGGPIYGYVYSTATGYGDMFTISPSGSNDPVIYGCGGNQPNFYMGVYPIPTGTTGWYPIGPCAPTPSNIVQGTTVILEGNGWQYNISGPLQQFSITIGGNTVPIVPIAFSLNIYGHWDVLFKVPVGIPTGRQPITLSINYFAFPTLYTNIQ